MVTLLYAWFVMNWQETCRHWPRAYFPKAGYLDAGSVLLHCWLRHQNLQIGVSSTSVAVTIPQCVENGSWSSNHGGHCPFGGVKVPRASSDHKLQQTVGDTRVAFARPARSLPSLTMLAQTIVTNLTFVRAAKQHDAWLCNFFLVKHDQYVLLW